MERDGNSLYAWQEQEPDGRWGIIAAMMPGMPGASPLVMRDFHSAMKLRSIARLHSAGSGRPVRLAEFTFEDVLDTQGPPPRG